MNMKRIDCEGVGDNDGYFEVEPHNLRRTAMKTLDEWAAEKCGVAIGNSPDSKYWSVMQTDGMLYVYSEWTLDDARCLAIAVEYFHISHWWAGKYEGETGEGWSSNCLNPFGDGEFVSMGKTAIESDIMLINQMFKEHMKCGKK